MTKQYGMVIDTTRCMGCHTCVISCKVSNDTPAGIYWSRVLSADRDRADKVRGTFPNATIGYSPELCNHCATPACVENCPTGAMHKREEDGVVISDPDTCIGCSTCVQSCPYEIPKVDEEAGVSSKCTLCYQRLAYDKLPWCVESCPANARFVGDINDPSSEVAKLIAEKNAKPLMEEFGTGPSVYYI